MWKVISIIVRVSSYEWPPCGRSLRVRCFDDDDPHTSFTHTSNTHTHGRTCAQTFCRMFTTRRQVKSLRRHTTLLVDCWRCCYWQQHDRTHLYYMHLSQYRSIFDTNTTAGARSNDRVAWRDVEQMHVFEIALLVEFVKCIRYDMVVFF